jgi:hypothetical protein
VSPPSIGATSVLTVRLFSIGNLSALYRSVWPQCWSTHEVCSANWIAAVDYLQIIGIIVGQVMVGFEGDWVGRKVGLVQDALIMTRTYHTPGPFPISAWLSLQSVLSCSLLHGGPISTDG